MNDRKAAPSRRYIGSETKERTAYALSVATDRNHCCISGVKQ